ncbi:2-oxoglutarate and iron-dependent oxygenase domain-containing protein, partial [Mycobacterium tuberculosis]|nr:2-oxoglutarate and iron-dependent oxygenase domain-containing protein [Mycobacterium tuberculosis]
KRHSLTTLLLSKKSRNLHMNAPLIPLVDLNSWQTGDAETRRSVAAEVDQALQQSGFLLLANHGVAPTLGTDAEVAAL